MPPAVSRTLTSGERRRLLVDCIPFLFFLVGTIFVATVWSDITERLSGQRTPLIVVAGLGVVLLVTGSIAVKRVRDVLAGAAIVERDHLMRLWRPRRGALGNSCYGRFEHLGTLRMSRLEFGRAGTAFDLVQLSHPGGNSGGPVPVVFRVTYSPASRIAWSVEPVS